MPHQKGGKNFKAVLLKMAFASCGTFENSLMHCFSDYFHREAYDLIHVGTVEIEIIANHNYSTFSDHHAGTPLLTKHWKDRLWRKGKKREESGVLASKSF